MGKKRPRAKRSRAARRSPFPAKSDPEYWRGRLFKNSFTYLGDRHEVRHWSVKIQHLGARKTFSFRAIEEKQAAAEACGIYKAIVNRGWKSVNAKRSEKGGEARAEANKVAPLGEKGFDAGYWAQRLIHRKYGESFRPNAEREFSVRVEHAGTSYYFPLGTEHEKIAAKNAARIYRVVASEGWDAACKRFPRELSLAFRWSDNPLAWTYTTVFTQTDSQREPGKVFLQQNKFRVGVVEPEPGLRAALCWCINQQDGCHCAATFANAAEALSGTPRMSLDLLLVSQNLPDKAGIACLNELNTLAPKVYGLLFSVFEDSELLFRSEPGGPPCYVFRRATPTRILLPIEAALKTGTRAREQFNKSVRRYFEEVVISSPIHGSSDELSNLTPREHEILGLLSKGHPDKEIADALRISTWTVHGHLKKIFEKLGAHNRTDAVVKYLNK